MTAVRMTQQVVMTTQWMTLCDDHGADDTTGCDDRGAEVVQKERV